MMPTAEGDRVAEARRAFPTLGEMTYLNVATHGLTPQPVLDRYLELISLTARYGHLRYDGEDLSAYRRARAVVAGILGVPTSWLAFTRNATDGMNDILSSLTWQPGDEVLTSDQEHPAVNFPLAYGARRGLFAVRTFAVDPDPAVTLRHVEESLTARTRLILCSHVSSHTGIRSPAAEICALAGRRNAVGRERPILTLIDGTQELGQWRVSVPAIGCDFYVTNGHKWLGGPKGSGMLVVRDGAFGLLTPPYMAGGIDTVESPVEDMLAHRDAARLFEAGTQNLAVVTVLADAIEWLDGLGWEWVERCEQTIAAYLRGRLRALPGALLLTPDAWDRSSAITSFSMDGLDARRVHQTLWAQRIITRYVPERNAIRISTPYFTSEEEVDRLIAAVGQIAREKG